MVCYDVADDTRRREIYRLLRGYGDHIQYSVFRCVLNKRRLAELHLALEVLVAPQEDQVLLIPLGSMETKHAWKAITIGRPVQEMRSGAVIL